MLGSVAHNGYAMLLIFLMLLQFNDNLLYVLISKLEHQTLQFFK